ncbi:hypothetical protein IJD44_02290 [bacterium]|nr:hypothetical protein [bacterium]
MFGLKNVKLVKELSNLKLQLKWLRFSASNNLKKARNDFLQEIAADNSFVREDLRIRAMVEEMLEKEFSPEIRNIKSYDFLVDSVVNKLKKNQLKSVPTIKDIK